MFFSARFLYVCCLHVIFLIVIYIHRWRRWWWSDDTICALIVMSETQEKSIQDWIFDNWVKNVQCKYVVVMVMSVQESISKRAKWWQAIHTHTHTRKAINYVRMVNLFSTHNEHCCTKYNRYIDCYSSTIFFSVIHIQQHIRSNILKNKRWLWRNAGQLRYSCATHLNHYFVCIFFFDTVKRNF